MQESIIRSYHLTKRFGTAFALKNVDFTVNRGEIFGIIGMSGAGKSTLIRCLTFLEKPTEGQIFLSGRELTSLSEKELRTARKSFLSTHGTRKYYVSFRNRSHTTKRAPEAGFGINLLSGA